MCLVLLVSSTWLGVGLGVIIATTFIILISCSKEEAESNLKYEYNEDILTKKETDFLTILNEFRQSKGLQVLKSDAYAGLLAYMHNLDMISEGKVSHEGYPERQKRLLDRGALNVAENIGMGYSMPISCFRAFSVSPDHLKNMKGNYNAVGIDITAGDKDYYTIIFIKI